MAKRKWIGPQPWVNNGDETASLALDPTDEDYYLVTFELKKKVYGRDKDFQRVAAEMEKHLRVVMHDEDLTLERYDWERVID